MTPRPPQRNTAGRPSRHARNMCNEGAFDPSRIGLGFESFAAPGSLTAAAIRFALACFRPFDDAPTDVDQPCEAKARPIAAASVGSTRAPGEDRLASKLTPKAQSALELQPTPSNPASAAPL